MKGNLYTEGLHNWMYFGALEGIELTQFWVCKCMIPLKYSLDMSRR